MTDAELLREAAETLQARSTFMHDARGTTIDWATCPCFTCSSDRQLVADLRRLAAIKEGVHA